MLSTPGSRYLFRPYQQDRALTPDLDYIGTSDIDRADRGERPDLVLPSYLSYGDYVGGSLEESNNRVFRERFADLEGTEWWNLHGMIGLDAGILIRADADERHPEVKEFFDALDEYPVADEDEMSEVEREHQNEQWVDYASRDFRKAFLSLVDDADGALESAMENSHPTEDSLAPAYWFLAEVTGTYPEEETGEAVLWNFNRVLRPVEKLVRALGEVNPAMAQYAVLSIIQSTADQLRHGTLVYRLWSAVDRSDDVSLRVASDVAIEHGDPKAGFDWLVNSVLR